MALLSQNNTRGPLFAQVSTNLSLVVAVNMLTTMMRMKALSIWWTQLVCRNHHISAGVFVRISGTCVVVVDSVALIRTSCSC